MASIYGRSFTVPARLCLCAQSKENMFGVKELDWPVQSPDLNPTVHFWEELERWLWTNLSAWPHKCSFEWMGINSLRHTLKSCGKPTQKSGGCCSCRGGFNLTAMSRRSLSTDCVPSCLNHAVVHAFTLWILNSPDQVINLFFQVLYLKLIYFMKILCILYTVFIIIITCSTKLPSLQ